MKVTLNEIYNVVQSNILNTLANSDLSSKGAYRVAKLIRQITPEFDTIEKQRISLVNKFGVKNDKGDTNVEADKLNEFQKELQDLFNTEVDLDVQPLTEDVLDKGVIKPITLLSLGKFLV